MSTISLRLPNSLHQQARELAEKEEISINRLIATALAEKISTLAADDYLRERAAHGSRQKFEKALVQVKDTTPAEEHSL